MPTLEKRIQTFIDLGKWFHQLANGLSEKDSPMHAEAADMADKAASQNGWFTPENIKLSWLSFSSMLEEEQLKSFLAEYKIPNYKAKSAKVIALILAGNIPAVGFHDLFCVLISGHKALLKLSGSDDFMMRSIVEKLIELEENLENDITITDGRLEEFDAVIATGSNNTSRYFEYYFGKYPNIIRKNRNGVAILDGTERSQDLAKLADDIFMYFGLGCRNISKIYVPEDYKFDFFYESIEYYKPIIDHHKYLNNYEYHKSIYLINSDPFLDNGFLMLREDQSIPSPLSVLHYEFYSDIKSLALEIHSNRDAIQCAIGKPVDGIETFDFGKSQFPNLGDFADGIDTIDFLLQLF